MRLNGAITPGLSLDYAYETFMLYLKRREENE